ncbi:hypothetical protein BHE74_00055670, partial [Ensete ventricosum]
IRARFREKTLWSQTLHKVEFRSIFRTPCQNFKILAVLNVLAHGKSYEHGFAKKCDGHQHCTKSSFDRFFPHHLKIS